jgi:hypothetical protein
MKNHQLPARRPDSRVCVEDAGFAADIRSLAGKLDANALCFPKISI